MSRRVSPSIWHPANERIPTPITTIVETTNETAQRWCEKVGHAMRVHWYAM